MKPNLELRRKAADVAREYRLKPESNLYLAGMELSERTGISLVLAKYYLARAAKILSEGKDPLDSQWKGNSGGPRANSGWKKGRKRKIENPPQP